MLPYYNTFKTICKYFKFINLNNIYLFFFIIYYKQNMVSFGWLVKTFVKNTLTPPKAKFKKYNLLKKLNHVSSITKNSIDYYPT